MRPRSRPSWTYPLFTDTFKLQKRSVDFSGKQPPLERQVQPKKAPSESRIYPRDFDTFARGVLKRCISWKPLQRIGVCIPERAKDVKRLAGIEEIEGERQEAHTGERDKPAL